MRPQPFAQSYFELYRRKLQYKLTGVISLYARSHEKKGTILISYISNPFLVSPSTGISPSHTAPWECAEIARLWLARGYGVDIIEWTNTSFIPKKEYAYVIDIHQNLERLAPYLGKNTKKIMHIVSAYWKFQNDAEENRLKNLQARKGVLLQAHRTMSASKNTQYADYLEGLGNSFTQSTYAFTGKKIFPIPVSTTVEYASPELKDFAAIRKNFVWLGGGGMVHKGLDLVLEVFKDMPDYSLTICGPVSAEKDFEKLYWKELYETPHIKVMGKINIASSEFKTIITNSLALIYPSSSEGQSGAVIASMHAGLIPIISYESGVDVEDFGIVLTTCTKEEIKQALISLSSSPEETLKEKALQAWTHARTHHTHEAFTKAYNEFITTIL